MNKLINWRGRTTSLALLIGLFIIALGLAWWMEKTIADNTLAAEQLDHFATKVHLKFAQISESLNERAAGQKTDVATNRVAEIQKDLRSSLKELQARHADKDLVNAMDALWDFVSRNRFAEQTEGDAAAPAALYAKAASEREHLLLQFDQQIGNVKTAEGEKNIRVSRNCLIWLIVVVVAVIAAGFAHSSAVAKPLAQLVGALERMRRGDFTQRLKLDRTDEFGVLGEGFNRLAEDLSALVGQVQRSGIQVNTTATEISATARQQQTTANEIAATTAEIGATSKEISATSMELVKTMNEVSEVAEETAGVAGSGQSAINSMEATMRQIMDASGSITAKLAVLSEKTSNINSVVTTITKVADQTNLLSLNAAIEAEKAGEYGLGFAVVAMEIRRLADQTAVATYDIEKMVKEMQSAVAAGVMGMDKFSEEARHGVGEIRQVSAQLAQIIQQVQALNPRFQAVNEGMQSQATGAQQISETLTQLTEAARQTAESLRQSNQAIEQLNTAARGLQTSVSRFRLEAV